MLLWLLWACSFQPQTVHDEGSSPGECTNGLDDDGDGFIDCLDFDCDPVCDTGEGA